MTDENQPAQKCMYCGAPAKFQSIGIGNSSFLVCKEHHQMLLQEHINLLKNMGLLR